MLSGVNCGIEVGGGMRLKREYLCSTAVVTEHTVACTTGVGITTLGYRELCFEKATDLHPHQTSPSLAEVTRTAYCTKEALSRVHRLCKGCSWQGEKPWVDALSNYVALL